MENRAEIHQLYRIFCRIWAAGGKATFSTQSHEGLCTARLELQTGQPTAGAAGATQNVKSAQQRAHRAHRGPASKARSRARAKAFQAGKAASTAQTTKESISQEELPLPGGSTTMSSPPTPSTAPSRTPSPKRAAPPPPPPPCPPPMPLPGPVTSTRLVKFIPRERSIKSHFFQLDGQNDGSVEGASGELQPNQSRGESESAPVTGKSHQDDDKDIETHEKEGHWTLVDRGKKSPKKGKGPLRLPPGHNDNDKVAQVANKVRCQDVFEDGTTFDKYDYEHWLLEFSLLASDNGHDVGWAKEGNTCAKCSKAIRHCRWRIYPKQCGNCWRASVKLDPKCPFGFFDSIEEEGDVNDSPAYVKWLLNL